MVHAKSAGTMGGTLRDRGFVGHVYRTQGYTGSMGICVGRCVSDQHVVNDESGSTEIS